MDYLKDLIVIFGLAVGAVVIFNRLRLPAIAGFLFAGALAGPHGLSLVEGIEEVRGLAEIGVALLLFTIGIELSLAHLTRLRRTLWMGGTLQVLLTTLLVLAVGLTLGMVWKRALFLGMLLALSSTAIVLKLLAERGELDSPHGENALGILIFQDLCVVPMTLLTPFLAGEDWLPGDMVWVGGKALLVVGMAIVASRLLVPWVLGQVVATHNREIFLLTIILLCVGTAWLTAQAGLSLALGAFLAGLVVSESEYSHEALGEILPFRHAFNGIFFVSVGMLFDGRALLASPLVLGVGVPALIVAKAAVVAAVVVLLGYSLRVGLRTGLALAQVGEFSFVLAMVGASSGILTESLFQLFVGAAVLTMAVTPLLWGWSAQFAERFADTRPGRRGLLRETAAAEALQNHVLIVGYGVNGRNLVRVLERVQIPFLVVEINPELVRSERRKGVPILYGDAANREILERAGIRRARVLVLAISDPAGTRRAAELARRLNPTVHIIVRTRYVREMESLFALGTNEVVPEEFETSVEIFSRVLRTYLVPRDIVERSVREIRQDGYEMFRTFREAHQPVEAIRQFVKGMELEIYRIEEGSPLAGQSLAQTQLRTRTGVTIVAIQTDSQVRPNPAPSTTLAVGNVVLVLGTPEQLGQAAALFRGLPANPSESTPA